VVTGNNLFCRSIGSAVGVAVFGAIANATLGSPIGGATSGGHSSADLSTATHDVVLAVAALSLAMTAVIFVLPKHAQKSVLA
jgi:hypothetical protein